jgi:hypothetical protein
MTGFGNGTVGSAKLLAGEGITQNRVFKRFCKECVVVKAFPTCASR